MTLDIYYGRKTTTQQLSTLLTNKTKTSIVIHTFILHVGLPRVLTVKALTRQYGCVFRSESLQTGLSLYL